jgi:hypothetical protein
MKQQSFTSCAQHVRGFQGERLPATDRTVAAYLQVWGRPVNTGVAARVVIWAFSSQTKKLHSVRWLVAHQTHEGRADGRVVRTPSGGLPTTYIDVTKQQACFGGPMMRLIYMEHSGA